MRCLNLFLFCLFLLLDIVLSTPFPSNEEGYIYRRPAFNSHFGEGRDDETENVGAERDREAKRLKREDLIVSTPLGQLKGQLMTSRGGHQYAAFVGIPYAEKTERFEPAKPVKPWNGVKEALNYSSVCPQYHGWNGFGHEIIGNEDCLYLNVYYPQEDRCLNEPEKLSVLFHIHGGAFVEGSGGKFLPTNFMDECIVFVSMNYRLGALGFLATDDGRIPGNLGLKDQLLALRWTKNNIENFRGDLNKITIMGISAGSASVSHLIASPAAKGLFIQAIAGSGSVLNPWAIITNPGERARELGQLLNCTDVDSTSLLKDCLKSRDLKDFVIYQERAKKWNTDPHSISPIIELPTSEFDPDYEPIQTRDPYILLRDGDFNQVPLIIGFTNEEGVLLKAGLVMMNATAVKELNTDWNNVAPIAFYYDRLNLTQSEKDQVSREIRQFYFNNENVSTETFNKFANLHSDRNFNYGILKTADLHSKYAPVYTYVFNYTGLHSFTTILLGYPKPIVSHADDFLYLYQIPELPSHAPGSEQEKFSQNLVKLWTTFAQKGIPDTSKWSPRPQLEWTPYTEESPSILKLDSELKLLLGDYLTLRRSFWDNSPTSQVQYPPNETQMCHPLNI